MDVRRLTKTHLLRPTNVLVFTRSNIDVVFVATPGGYENFICPTWRWSNARNEVEVGPVGVTWKRSDPKKFITMETRKIFLRLASFFYNRFPIKSEYFVVSDAQDIIETVLVLELLPETSVKFPFVLHTITSTGGDL